MDEIKVKKLKPILGTVSNLTMALTITSPDLAEKKPANINHNLSLDEFFAHTRIAVELLAT